MTRVLLVDDDAANRLTLGSLLEDEGIEVDVADSLGQARAKLGDGAYDVIMLDQHLGDGLGTSLVASVRARLPAAKVMLISGSVEPESLPRDVYLDAVLAKGTRFDDLVSLMRTLVRDPSRTP